MVRNCFYSKFTMAYLQVARVPNQLFRAMVSVLFVLW